MFEPGKGFAPTGEGTPQGGVISPCLLNVALHGLEEAAGVRYRACGKEAAVAKAGSPVVIRYADDLVALCHSQQQAEQVKAQLAGWLAPRGLVLAATLSAHGSAAFDVHGLAGLGGDDVGWRSGSGCAVAGMVVAAEKKAGERVDGFEQQGVDLGLLVSGVPGAVAGGEPVPSGGCLLLVPGSLVPGLVAGLPPAQCFGAGHDPGGGLRVSLW